MFYESFIFYLKSLGISILYFFTVGGLIGYALTEGYVNITLILLFFLINSIVSLIIKRKMLQHQLDACQNNFSNKDLIVLCSIPLALILVAGVIWLGNLFLPAAAVTFMNETIFKWILCAVFPNACNTVVVWGALDYSVNIYYLMLILSEALQILSVLTYKMKRS